MKSFVINYPGEVEPEKTVDAVTVFGAVEHDSTELTDDTKTAVYIAIESLGRTPNGDIPFVWGDTDPSGAETTISCTNLPADASPLGKPSIIIFLNRGLG